MKFFFKNLLKVVKKIPFLTWKKNPLITTWFWDFPNRQKKSRQNLQKSPKLEFIPGSGNTVYNRSAHPQPSSCPFLSFAFFQNILKILRPLKSEIPFGRLDRVPPPVGWDHRERVKQQSLSQLPAAEGWLIDSDFWNLRKLHSTVPANYCENSAIYRRFSSRCIV